MWFKSISISSMALMACVAALADVPAGLQIRTNRPDSTVTIESSPAEGKALVNVVDARNGAVLGLGAGDFSVARAGEAAKVVSVEPVDRTADAPRHAVLVLDNSYSMKERKAVKKVLDEVGAVLKTIRPIDDVRMVVLREKAVKVAGRDLHEETYKSNNVADLQAFAANAYRDENITLGTCLYEGIDAGLELIRQMPADEPRFLWVFSDGEDINSAFKSDVVTQAAQGLRNFRVLVVDYMPGSKIDDFLSKFASQNDGLARKTGAEADLLALFQQAGSRTDHRYVVGYEFPPPPAIAKAAPPPPSPKTIFFDAALFDFAKANLKPEGKEKIKAYREQAMAELSRADKVKITGYTDSVGSSAYNKKLSLKRAEAVRDYLVSLGVDANKLEVAGEGMANPVADNKTAGGRAKNRRVEVEVAGLAR